MIIDGRAIAEGVYTAMRERILLLSSAPVLTVITCAPNFETKKYLALKEKKAREVGIVTKIIELPSDTTTDDVIAAIDEAKETSSGIIVQLPLAPHIESEKVLHAIPLSHDADGLNPQNSTTLSPVVGAIEEILRVYDVDVERKQVVVIGKGRLVGLPASLWFEKSGAEVTVVTRDTEDIASVTRTADIIVSGAGVPGLLTTAMIKEGVIILDAGTSEEGGELKGDADPLCAEKATLFTPVPGGIGPITIAILLRNVVDCALEKARVV